jgi:SNF2 family DNA or RNA helicase
MVAEGTIDERVVRIVERKRSLIDTIIGADGAGAELLVGQEILGETE